MQSVWMEQHDALPEGCTGFVHAMFVQRLPPKNF